MMNLVFCVLCGIMIIGSDGIMIRKVCPMGEIHKSCVFSEEYVCWVNQNRLDRVKSIPKRLTHCQSGCFCKKGYVREYRGGGCIVAAECRDQTLWDMINKLPLNLAFELF